jgi:hypothetical protein
MLISTYFLVKDPLPMSLSMNLPINIIRPLTPTRQAVASPLDSSTTGCPRFFSSLPQPQNRSRHHIQPVPKWMAMMRRTTSLKFWSIGTPWGMSSSLKPGPGTRGGGNRPQWRCVGWRPQLAERKMRHGAHKGAARCSAGSMGSMHKGSAGRCIEARLR